MNPSSLFLSLALCFSSSILLAQANSIKLNASSSILGDYSIGLERGVGKNISIGLWGNFRPYLIWNTTFDGLNLQRYTIMPEIRYYLEENRTYTGFFVGLYAKYKMFEADFDNLVVIFKEEAGSSASINLDDVTVYINSLPVGPLLGYKTISASGLTLELNGGIGTAIYRQTEIEASDRDGQEGTADLSILPIGRLDFRFGMVLGYSF